MSNNRPIFIQVEDSEAIEFLTNRIAKLQEVISAKDNYILALQEEVRNFNKNLAIPETNDYITGVNKSNANPLQTATNPDLVKADSDDDPPIESIVPGKAYSPRKGNRRLTDTQVVLIKEMLQSGVSVGDISKQLDVFPGIISGIRAGLTYREDLPLPVTTLPDNNKDNCDTTIVVVSDNNIHEEGVQQ